MTLLEATGLVKRYAVKRDWLGRVKESFTAVDDVSFTLDRGETLALVGESGAGKSTTARLVARLVDADAGAVVFDGTDLTGLRRGGRALRARRVDLQMIFQDPYSSLDPRVTVLDAVAEPLVVHHGLDRATRHRRAAELLEKVGVRADLAGRMPAELSGGQLQRVSIARALTLAPKLLVCDEPVAALDVSVQAQVINLLSDLQADLGLAYLFISHDLSVVRSFAHRVAIMKDGRIVEEGPARRILTDPSHEYSRELVRSIPRLPGEQPRLEIR